MARDNTEDESITINFRHAENYKQLTIASGYLWDEEVDLPAHRVVAENYLGHLIDSGMNVHHINHIKTDNRPENLLVISEWVHMLLHAAYLHQFYYRPFKVITDPEALVARLRAEGIPFEWCGRKGEQK